MEGFLMSSFEQIKDAVAYENIDNFVACKSDRR